MRESIGGTWILGFVVLFIVLFSGYLAVSINYTKAFQTKNKILNIIEQYEGFDKTLGEDSTVGVIDEYIRDTGYFTTDESIKNKCGEDYVDGGYCVKKICSSKGNYYKVTTFIKIELPVIWTSFTIPISGETKTIFYDITGSCE